MEILKILRKRDNKTQQDVASYLGITYQAYAHYEKGRNQPDPETLRKLADFFNVSADMLLGRAETPTEQMPITITTPPDMLEEVVSMWLEMEEYQRIETIRVMEGLLGKDIKVNKNK